MPYENTLTTTPTWGELALYADRAYVNMTARDTITEIRNYIDAQDQNIQTTAWGNEERIRQLEVKVNQLEILVNAKVDVTELLACIAALEEKVAKLDKLVNWQTLMLSDEEGDSWQ